ncbi:MAG TPA: ABC transporter permease [Fimbriimonadaceae bacterium]|nr:ABC transporter permease [Fimbriimonadaceae bacterium]
MKRVLGFVQRYDVLVVFALLFAVNAIWQPGVFLLPENLRNLVNQNVAVGIIALGMTLVIATGGIDLSVGSLMALSAAISVLALDKLIAGGGSEATASAVAILVCVGAGLVLGVANGLMVAFGRVAPFVATLVGLVAYRSLCMALADGGEIRSSSSQVFPSLGEGGVPLPFVHIAGGGPLIITWGMLLFVAVAIVASLMLNRMVFGRYSVATGSNEQAARYAGVNTRAAKFWAYAALGLFTGIAGVTVETRMNSVASSSMGLYYELDAIAAVVIGGTSLRGGSGRIWGTVVGVLLLGVITNMLVTLGVSVYWQGVVKGAIILFAALMQRGRAE